MLSSCVHDIFYFYLWTLTSWMLSWQSIHMHILDSISMGWEIHCICWKNALRHDGLAVRKTYTYPLQFRCASTNRNSQCSLQCSGRTKPWQTLSTCLWHNLISRIWAPGSQVPSSRLQMMNTMHMSMGISGMKVLIFWNFERWVLSFVNMHCTCIFITTIE